MEATVSVCLSVISVAQYNCSVGLCSWLIEVNASPSLTASSKEDYDLKCRLLDDVLNVIDLENRYSPHPRPTQQPSTRDFSILS